MSYLLSFCAVVISRLASTMCCCAAARFGCIFLSMSTAGSWAAIIMQYAKMLTSAAIFLLILASMGAGFCGRVYHFPEWSEHPVDAGAGIQSESETCSAGKHR